MYNSLEYNPFTNKIRHATKEPEKPRTYLVYDIEKDKTKVRGYWQDKGHLYKDNIKQVKADNWKRALSLATSICRDKRQACVTVKGMKHSYLINDTGKIIRTFIAKKYIPIKSKHQIKDLIKQYGGLTIYRTLTGLQGEVFF